MAVKERNVRITFRDTLSAKSLLLFVCLAFVGERLWRRRMTPGTPRWLRSNTKIFPGAESMRARGVRELETVTRIVTAVRGSTIWTRTVLRNRSNRSNVFHSVKFALLSDSFWRRSSNWSLGFGSVFSENTHREPKQNRKGTIEEQNAHAQSLFIGFCMFFENLAPGKPISWAHRFCLEGIAYLISMCCF